MNSNYEIRDRRARRRDIDNGDGVTFTRNGEVFYYGPPGFETGIRKEHADYVKNIIPDFDFKLESNLELLLEFLAGLESRS